jgi:hypothetical protein
MTVLLGAMRHWRFGDNVSATLAALQCFGDAHVRGVGAGTASLQIAGRRQIMSAAEVGCYCCGVALVAVYGVVHVAHVFVGDAVG